MADITASIGSWSTTESSNAPSGSTTIGTGLDDNLRAIQAAVKTWYDTAHPISRRNMLHNGALKVAQRGTSFTSATTPANNDDTYLLDGCILLSDGNDIVDVSQDTTTIPTGGYAAIQLDVETANKKFGILFPVEKRDCHHVLGGTCSVSFKARKGGSNSTVGTVRAALLAWSSTADSITSDVVSAWNASGTRPTLVANWTAENTDSDLTLTTSYQTFTVNNISVDTASAANIALLIYYNNADGTVGDLVYITDVQVEPGTAASEFERRPFQEDVELCQRYYEKSYNTDVAPGTNTTVGANRWFDATTGGYFPLTFKVSKRATPSCTIYTPAGVSGSMRDETSGADIAATVSYEGMNGAVLTGAHGATNETISYHWVATAEL